MNLRRLMVQHLEGKATGRLPVWLMRQAGRYLPNYRALREKHTFWEMVTTPALAAQVTLLPFEVIDVDGAIFFSDILTLPYGMGTPIEMQESVGPVITKPLQGVRDFEFFASYDPEKHTAFVGDALRHVRKALPDEKCLLGFAGAPWTVGCYLIQGQGKNDFGKMVERAKRDPRELTECLELLSAATAKYLKYQVASGVDIVQIFDTWLPNMDPMFFSEYYRPMLSHLIDDVRKSGVKVIYFSRGNDRIAQFDVLGCDVLSFDHTVDLKAADKMLRGAFSLQGNLDPEILLKGDVASVRKATRELVAVLRSLKRPAIANLGHGIMPKTPVENVVAFVEEAQTLWI